LDRAVGSKAAVVLLSGGLDSYTAAGVAARDGFTLHALTVDYGQRHRREIAAAGSVARALRVSSHKVVAVDLASFGGSALTGEGAIPKEGVRPGIPATYVPARNTVLLALALAWAETLGATTIVIGVNAVDYSGYPDCRPDFVDAFERLATLATRSGAEGGRFRIYAPLIDFSKAAIVRTGLDLGLDYALTSSCYDPSPEGRPCGRCDSCLLRARGFAEAGTRDPLLHS
jgi:7-cyano-7-deazaguanine synthase